MCNTDTAQTRGRQREREKHEELKKCRKRCHVHCLPSLTAVFLGMVVYTGVTHKNSMTYGAVDVGKACELSAAHLWSTSSGTAPFLLAHRCFLFMPWPKRIFEKALSVTSPPPHVVEDRQRHGTLLSCATSCRRFGSLADRLLGNPSTSSHQLASNALVEFWHHACQSSSTKAGLQRAKLVGSQSELDHDDMVQLWRTPLPATSSFFSDVLDCIVMCRSKSRSSAPTQTTSCEVELKISAPSLNTHYKIYNPLFAP